jgi:hypothetical protein
VALFPVKTVDAVYRLSTDTPYIHATRTMVETAHAPALTRGRSISIQQDANDIPFIKFKTFPLHHETVSTFPASIIEAISRNEEPLSLSADKDLSPHCSL